MMMPSAMVSTMRASRSSLARSASSAFLRAVMSISTPTR
jgi:hypothetical protein